MSHSHDVQAALDELERQTRATLIVVQAVFVEMRAAGIQGSETARCVAIAKTNLETAMLWVLAGKPHESEAASKIQLS